MEISEQLADNVIGYEINTSIAWIVIGLIICITGIVFLISEYKNVRQNYNDEVAIFFVVVGIIAIIFSIAIVITQAFDIIQAYSLPEKTLWKYINKQT